MKKNTQYTKNRPHTKRHVKNRYSKYGYLFLMPFVVLFIVFQLIPLGSTFYRSLFSYIIRNKKTVVTFCGMDNFKNIFGIGEGERAYIWIYLKNTIIMWLQSFIPQIVLAMLLAVWLTDSKHRIKGGSTFKILVYLPAMITAASASVLFHTLFSDYGPVMQLVRWMKLVRVDDYFMSTVGGSRGVISLVLLWMGYGATTLLLISGMVSINRNLYEVSELDGGTDWQKFRYITFPMTRPVILYVFITSAINGLQMYDVPALFNVSMTGLVGQPDDKTTTLNMYIMRLYNAGDVGRSAAVSVTVFAMTVLLSVVLYLALYAKNYMDISDIKKTR